MTGVAFARASVADAPAVAAFQTLAWQQTYRGLIDDALLDVGAEDRVERWAERIETGSRSVTIAWKGGSVVGVASSSVDDPPRAGLPARELRTLYLRRDAQRIGLGSRLLTAAIGDDDAHLLAFDISAGAHAFYERHGFTAEARVLLDSGTGLWERRWVRRRSTG